MSNFTYGDSCQTGDDKYVIAQFRSDASLGWIHDLRSFLDVRELKYKWFEPRRHHVQSKRDLWEKVSNGVYEAEITVVDPEVYRSEAIIFWLQQRAEPGIDFDERTITLQSSLCMISDSPLRIASLTNIDYHLEKEAYFPHKTIIKATPPLNSLGDTDFSPSELAQRAGGNLKDAIVLAARSHAMITPSQTAEFVSAGAFGGLGLLNFDEFKNMRRVFDREHPRSVPILNEFYERLGHALSWRRRLLREGRNKEIVSEAGSQESDHIQAADIAAGWAVDILIFTNGDYRTLAQRFASVAVNGVIVPG